MNRIHFSECRFPPSDFGLLRLVVALGLVALTATCVRAQTLPGPPPPDFSTGEKPSPLPTVKDPASMVVARVNGTPIFQSEVEGGVTGVIHNQKLDADSLVMVQAAVLQQLVERLLVHQYLTVHKLTANEAEVNASIDRLRATLQQQNSNLDDFLVRNHQTESSLRTLFSFDLGWNKYVAKNTNDDNLQALFKQFHEQFDGTERRVSHILLRPDGVADPTKIKALVEQASKLRDQINSGKLKFEEAAEKFSAGPSRSRGGDLGYIPVNGVMVEQFSKAAFALKPDEISEPLVTPFGVHLIKVTDIKPGKKTWQDVRDALQQKLSDFLMNQLMKNQLSQAVVEFAAGVPHFKKGTTELEVSDNAANLQ